jgi:tRNA pseudouridine55 synthase
MGPNGFLLIDKPPGPTSHDVVDAVRRLSGVRRVGHAGTLDPFASGLLVIGVGEATKQLSRFVGLDKVYEAVFVLGATSDTDDRTGNIEMRSTKFERISKFEIEKVLQKFTGNIEQVPPAYAAIKIGGKKMYEAARAGKPLEAPPRSVIVFSFELLEDTTHRIRVRIHCSSGTYVRALARDLGITLDTGAYVEELRRTKIGPFDVTQAFPLSKFLKSAAELAKSLPFCQDILVTLDRYEKRQIPPFSL